jgi:hypothetical protein
MSRTQQFVQLDIPLAGGQFANIPKNVAGRVNVDDFVFFHWPPAMNARDYTVVLETNDTSGPNHYRTVGLLQTNVELPFVQFDAYGRILVIPTHNANLPRFFARLNRGSTYVIPDVSASHRPGYQHAMARHGILTSGADNSNTLL